MTEAPPFTPAPAAAPVMTLDCVRCGYRLANPHPDGHCTECGAPIAASIGAPFDVAGQRRLRRGAWLLLLFALIVAPNGTLSIIDPTILPSWVSRPLSVALFGMQLAGIWLLTSPPRISHRFDRYRRWTRVLALIAIGPSIGELVSRTFPPAVIREAWASEQGPLWFGVVAALLCIVAVIVRQAGARFNLRDLWIITASIVLGALAMFVLVMLAGPNSAPSMIIAYGTGVLGGLMPLLLAVWITHVLGDIHSPLRRRLLTLAVVFASVGAVVNTLQLGLVIWALHGGGWPPDWVLDMVIALRYPRLAGVVLVPLLLALVVLRVIPRTESS